MLVRLQISAMVFMMVQAVLFGAGMVAILMSPLRDQAMVYIPLMIATTAVVAAAISWGIAPRFRMTYWRGRGVDHDSISG